MTLRPAIEADLPTIRDLQIASWRRAYRGMLSDAFLDGPMAEILAGRWGKLLGPGWRVETAWRGDRLAGFVSVDVAREGGAYVDNLHVADWAEGQGVARALMAKAAEHALEGGVSTLWLTVIRENQTARGVYRRLGGQEGEPKPDRLYGEPIVAIPVVWSDQTLHDLAATRSRSPA